MAKNESTTENSYFPRDCKSESTPGPASSAKYIADGERPIGTTSRKPDESGLESPNEIHTNGTNERRRIRVTVETPSKPKYVPAQEQTKSLGEHGGEIGDMQSADAHASRITRPPTHDGIEIKADS